MQTTAPAPQDQPLNLLADWISREQLASELGIACDTLARWEARQLGPPCTRIGRKVLYRRSTVENWINAQEQTRPTRPRRGRK
ncbi:helix-turn-helix transcriptional regulator [Yoonia vestfoldensis]|jgi:predicted DNA-binding transcriptional regulator AlpA|uniref:helix-turn-helix transcriptional regulator n=1 Tax=Yoonia vestfoldensis TaxID=245188 RepID=UPI0003821AAF|nr:DNA-binding protein [Yoonia vestfoldensis]